MSLRSEEVGRGDSTPPRFARRFEKTKDTNPEEAVVRELTTPEQWLQAAQSGRVHFQTVMANEASIPPEDFDAIVTSCGDVPTF